MIEALADVCRRHTSLLDGLADTYRAEIDRVLAGDLAAWSGESGHQRLFVACAELVNLAAGARRRCSPSTTCTTATTPPCDCCTTSPRSTIDPRVALVASYRATPRSTALHDPRASLLSRHTATEVELRPLEHDAIAALTGAHPAT